MIESMKFPFSEITLFLGKLINKLTIWSCIFFMPGMMILLVALCSFWTSYGKKAVGPSGAASPEHLKCDQPGPFCGHCLEGNSSESAELVPLRFSCRWFTRYSNKLLGVMVFFPKCY